MNLGSGSELFQVIGSRLKNVIGCRLIQVFEYRSGSRLINVIGSGSKLIQVLESGCGNKPLNIVMISFFCKIIALSLMKYWKAGNAKYGGK